MPEFNRPLLACLVFIAFTANPLCAREIKVSDTARVNRDSRHAFAQLLQKGVADIYRENGQRDAKWDEQASFLLDGFGPWLANRRVGNDRFSMLKAPDATALLASGKKAIDAGCTDPAVVVAYATVLAERDKSLHTAQLATAAYQQLAKESPYHPFLAGLALQAARRQMRDEADARLLELSPLLCAQPNLSSDVLRAYRTLIFDGAVPPGRDKETDTLLAKLADAKADPWLIEQTTGEADIARAWQARSGAPAAAVSRERFAEFFNMLESAQTHLEKSASLRRDLPHGASSMISASMGLQDPPQLTRQWFDRATKAMFDYIPAYDSYAFTLLPRWGGSPQALWNFACECAATKRFDTGVPYQTIAIARMLTTQPDGDPALVRSPAAFEEIQAVLRGYAAMDDSEWAWRELKEWANFCDRQDVVEEAARNIKGPTLAEEVKLRVAPLFKEKRWDEALVLYDELLAKYPGSESELLWNKFRVAVLKKDGALAGKLAGEQMRYIGGNCSALNEMAWMLISTPDLKDRPVDIALAIANEAVALTQGAHPEFDDTLARAYFEKGDVEAAIKWQAEAVRRADGKEQTELAETLKKYEKSRSPATAPVTNEATPRRS